LQKCPIFAQFRKGKRPIVSGSKNREKVEESYAEGSRWWKNFSG